MLLIDEHTESKLVMALESFRIDPQMDRYIYLRAAYGLAQDDYKERIFTFAQQYLAGVDARIYACRDGDIFIIAPIIPSKQAREFILALVEHQQRAASDDWVEFNEVLPHLGRLLVAVESKLNLIRQLEAEEQKLLEKQKQERKRNAILNGATHQTSQDIKNRRQNREKPELMMIEDDVFSRKLVSTVIQKQYALTGLGETTHALDTYARIAPDLLFLDINLPDVTGHELLEKILKMDPEAYVIMLSGNCDQKNISQAMSIGAKGFIAKPFTKEKLFQYIDRCLAK